ncbi:hypothetical protein [Parapedobacter koreensis]|nr:hypothetical protein [Parapedobacter koreensis]
MRIPNVFTPDGDELTIVNRWGNEVYRNINYRNDRRAAISMRAGIIMKW